GCVDQHLRPTTSKGIVELGAAGLIAIDGKIGARVEAESDEVLYCEQTIHSSWKLGISSQGVQPLGQDEVGQWHIARFLDHHCCAAVSADKVVELRCSIHVEPQLDGSGERAARVERY